MTPSEMDRARKVASEMLMERLADDAMDLEEFERWLDQVNAAASVNEIAEILGKVAAASPYAPIPRVRPPDPADPDESVVPPLVPRKPRKGLRRRQRKNRVVLAFQDGAGRVGPWRPSRHVWVVNMLGGAVMDFREAALPPGVTELTVFCMMGDVEIVVPLDLQVEFGGLGLVGGFDCEATVGVSSPDAPTLRINGVSCLGRVSVSVRSAGEEAPAPRRARPRRVRSRDADAADPPPDASRPAPGPRHGGPSISSPSPGVDPT